MPCYLALADDEVSDLMRRISSRFPMATEFGAQEPGERNPQMRMGIINALTNEVFVPATDEEISSYKNRKYPEWFGECEKILRKYHTLLERRCRRSVFIFSVTNDGTRPAKDALITVEAKGRFEIMPPRRRENDEENQPLALARPPRPPQGKWERGSLFGAFEAMQRSLAVPLPLDAQLLPKMPILTASVMYLN